MRQTDKNKDNTDKGRRERKTEIKGKRKRSTKMRNKTANDRERTRGRNTDK